MDKANLSFVLQYCIYFLKKFKMFQKNKRLKYIIAVYNAECVTFAVLYH